MSIPTFRPTFTVTAFKTRARSDTGQPSRLQGLQVWDLTSYLGDGSEISVSKSLLSPKGSFVITLPDQPFAVAPEYGGVADTLYGLLEPMDEIEIRLARSPEQYGGNALPLLMRGFIRSIRRAESMSGPGKPQRTTIIQGNDYGWIFEMTQMPPMVYLSYGLGLQWQQPWQAFFQIGENQEPRHVGAFFQLMLTHLIQVQLETMNARFTVIPLDNPDDVAGQVVMTQQDQLIGPIWNIFMTWADSPWNELWVDDPETLGNDPPRLRFRPAPYRTWIKNGQLLSAAEPIKVMGQTATAEFVDLGIADVLTLDASRSEQDVSNVYWVNSSVLSQQQAISVEMSKAAGAGTGTSTGTGTNGNLPLPEYLILDGDAYPNSDPDLYCYREMTTTSKLLPERMTTGLDGQTKEKMEAAGGLHAEWPDWAKDRRKALVEMNCDNVVLENGTLTVKGNERIRAGKYLRLTRGDMVAEYYAQSVTHRFAPYQQYTTTVQFIRGTGFIERTRLTDSPYLHEGKQGVYSNPT